MFQNQEKQPRKSVIANKDKHKQRTGIAPDALFYVILLYP
jgi:hypothetical protein